MTILGCQLVYILNEWHVTSQQLEQLILERHKISVILLIGVSGDIDLKEKNIEGTQTLNTE